MANDPSVINTIIDLFDKLQEPLSGVLNVVTSFQGLGQGLDAARTSLTQFSNLVPVLGPVAQTMGGFVDTARQQTDALGRFGIGLGDVSGQFARLAETGLTQEQYQRILTENQRLVAGATAEERAQRLLNINEMAKQTTIGKQLLDNSTAHLETIAEAVALEINRNGAIIESEEQMRAVAERAAVTAAQFDSLSRISGQSRDQLSAETRERLSSTRNTMFMNLLSEEQRNQYTKMVNSMQALGPGVQDLVQMIAMNARPSEQQRMQLAALGGEGARLQTLVRATMDAKTPEDRRRAELELEELKVRIGERQSTREYFNMMVQAKSPIGGAAEQLATENRIKDAVNAQLEAMRRTRPEATYAEAYAEIQKRTQLEAAQRIGVGPQAGQVDPRQIFGTEINRTMIAAQTQSAGLARAIDQVAINSLKAADNLNTFTQSMDKFREIFGGDKTTKEKSEELLKYPEKIKQGIIDMTGAAPVTSAPPVAPGQQLGPPPSGSSIRNFNIGTFETLGSWFNDFGSGTLARLHGNEAVVPFDQLEKFISYVDTTLTGTKTFTSNIPTELTTATRKPLEEIAKTMEKEIKSVGAGLSQVSSKLSAPKTTEISNSDDIAAKSFSTPRTKTIIKEPFNAADAMAMSLTGKMPQARTNKEDQLYKERIIGGQVGPNPVEARREAQEKTRIDSISKLEKKSLTIPKEGKLVSPELQKILEEGESGKAYEVTGPAAEETFKSMQAQMGEIKAPTASQLPSMEDLASKMKEGTEPVKKGLDAAAKMVPEMAGMGTPGSLGDVVGMLGKLHSTMSSIATSSKAMEGYNRTTAKHVKMKSGSLI